MDKRTKKLQKGITLIALVITIIVLLILAGVSIATLTGDNGILTNAGRAKTETGRQAAKEKVETAVLASYDKRGNLDYDRLKTSLNSIEGISEKLTDEITENSFNIEIWVDGYKVIIHSDGTVEAEGEYIAEKNPPKGREEAIPVETTNHTAGIITYSWEEIDSIAKVISNNSATIKKETTEEVNVRIGTKNYMLGVGDTKVVDGKTVRILGFNHDKLASSDAYGGDNEYAGISFEYVDFLTEAPINSDNTNSGGWASCLIRQRLNSESVENSILKDFNSEVKAKIKEVTKEYIQQYNDASSVKTCNDKLWLLSCGEIWDNGYGGGVTRGYAIATEGSQYKYYKNVVGSEFYKSQIDATRKPSVSSSFDWWLRSLYDNVTIPNCTVATNGNAGCISADKLFGITPGFAI